MIKSFYIAKKAALYLCVATVPTAAVVTRDPGPKTSRVIAKAKHSVNRVAHRKVFNEPKVEVAATAVATATATAYCPPSLGGGAGGGGGFFGSGGGPASPIIGGGGGIITNPPSVVPSVPEPATWGMMILGMFGIGGTIRSNKRKVLPTE